MTRTSLEQDFLVFLRYVPPSVSVLIKNSHAYKIKNEHNGQEEYGVKQIAVYGSFSKGSQTKRSDIDMLIQFIRDSKTQDAVVRNLEIIGEATKNLSAHLRMSSRKVPWKEMAGIRDKMVHHYFGVNYHY